jgi:pimeloyl-ACP methyl ester carboxylesterase
METKQIQTSIGEISISIKTVEGSVPIIFLHGVYFDHNLWNYQIKRITDRTLITIDMPFHGMSKNITNRNWSLDDCALMLLEILDELKIDKVIAVGHSWGSMTILRAAEKYTGRFLALGLCNMPFNAPTKKEVRQIKLQHSTLLFRKFYMQQAGKSLMGKELLAKNPNLLDKLITPMMKLTNKEIKYTDKAVRIEAKEASYLVRNLKMPVFALVGEEDYVGLPPIKELTIVKGGHVSPIEVPEEVYNFIKEVIKEW